MSAAHTPGPWSENPTDGIPAVGIDVGDGGELLPIVSVVHGRTKREARANRRLIARSPDLLAALDRLYAAAAHHISESDPLMVEVRARLGSAS